MQLTICYKRKGLFMLIGTQTWHFMRLTMLLLTVALVQVNARSIGQTVNYSARKTSLEKVFTILKQQTGYVFFYNDGDVQLNTPVSVDFKNTPLKEALTESLKNLPLDFQIKGKTIFITRKAASEAFVPQAAAPPAQVITGTVTDSAGAPIFGANIAIINLAKKPAQVSAALATTNKNGQFSLKVNELPVTLMVTFIGYGPRQITVTDAGTPVTISLKAVPADLQDMTISTGMFARKKASFTGATATYTGEQLITVSNQNVLQSLKTLDPSFIVMENNLSGSNPNTMPSIEIRGQSSVTSNNVADQFNADPNQPLFILDGFITSLAIINDLDINRVASITLLKDAASTALYGAKAANGVVVIETKKPKPGQLRLTYNGDFTVQAPDLNSYNMMNSSEELLFEKLSGRYTYFYGSSYPIQYNLDQLYSKHLQAVQKGVNTYWLNEPVQTGFTHAHSLFLEGGDENFRYGMSGNYKEISGVMKGSGRKTYSGTLDFSYRKNKFNLSNKFYINGYTADESPYGSFSTYVSMPAYFTKADSAGMPPHFLEATQDYYGATRYVTNPLYDASLPYINNTKALGFTDNLQLNYTITPFFQIQTGVSLNQTTTTSTAFVSPDNSAFYDSVYNKKGTYSNRRLNYFNYQANLGVSYAKLIARRHQITANLRGELEETRNNSDMYTAVGFPSGSTGNPAFSYGYPTGGKPAYASSVYRRNNAVGSINYSLDRKYLLDATLRADGSTAFGSNKKYTNFWSAGIGWNLHEEALLRRYRWINTFRVRLTRGTSGNQSFGTLTSTNTYTYNSNINLFGQGLDLTTLGNPNIAWQVTTSTNLGTDISLFNNRLSVNLNFFRKITDPLVVVVDLPSSTGLSNYPMNAGSINSKGFDASFRYTIISSTQKRIFWNVGATAGVVSSRYENFNGKLDALNKQNQLNNSLLRYTDGYSPTDIWAVRSMGIDPSSGNEVFQKKNGQYTFIYSASDIVRVGNSQPAIQGVVSTQVNIGGFSASVAIRYSCGADIYNTALFNKVENISYTDIFKNQDKRALYDRWKNPGDESRFKTISLINAQNTGTTPISSRFVQRENYLSGESINIGYNFIGKAWLKHVGMQGFRVSAYSNDFFRLSTVKRERGTDYPYANTVSFKINAMF